ncbi:MAG: hypothetical protein M3O71_07350 [Bacteroidota bacterium]|nr:hypothetical protein [Bacteroidota bacterium]
MKNRIAFLSKLDQVIIALEEDYVDNVDLFNFKNNESKVIDPKVGKNIKVAQRNLQLLRYLKAHRTFIQNLRVNPI